MNHADLWEVPSVLRAPKDPLRLLERSLISPGPQGLSGTLGGNGGEETGCAMWLTIKNWQRVMWGKMLWALFFPQICLDCCQKSESFWANGPVGRR